MEFFFTRVRFLLREKGVRFVKFGVFGYKVLFFLSKLDDGNKNVKKLRHYKFE